MENQNGHSNVIYPHTYQVRVTPWPLDESKGKAVAAVQLLYGPIQISAKLYHSDSGVFLGMPRRKNETTGDYWNHVTIHDRTLLENFQKMAIQEYYNKTGEVVNAA